MKTFNSSSGSKSGKGLKVLKVALKVAAFLVERKLAKSGSLPPKRP